MQDSVCAVHPDRPALETCPKCHRDLCEGCMGYFGRAEVCTTCARALETRRTRVWVGVIALVGVGVAAGVALAVHGLASVTFDPPAIAALKKRLSAAPCDQRLVAKLADQLNEAGRFKETLKTGQAWHARCGADGYLDWKLFYAAKELGRWHQAVALADGLVAGDPRDSDFWWWRGEVRARIGHADAALADYRQSIANSDGANAAGFAVARIVDPARAGHQPCEAADAIQYFVDDLGGRIAPDLRADMVSFMQQGHCLAKARGAGAFATGDPLHPVVVHAEVGGTPGRFHVDATTGTTAVSRAFAKRAGIAVGTERAATFAEGQPRTGRLAATTVAIGGAHAQDVEVLVVKDLGAKVDGVIGLDYLWRFDRAEHGSRVAITARR